MTQSCFIRQWNSKKLPEDFRIALFNVILKKSNVKALELEDELNIPLHIPLPSLKKSIKDEDKSENSEQSSSQEYTQ